MADRGWPKRAAVLAALVAVYFVAGKLGLRLAFVHASATAVWAPTGIALAAFLVLGRWVWPGILVGAFLVNVTTAGSAVTSLGIGFGNMLEGLVGSLLVTRFANGRKAFERARDVFGFAVLAAVVSTAVSPTIGITSLSLGGFAEWRDYSSIWLTWWLGDAAGALVVAPAVVLWATVPSWPRSRRQWIEAVGLLLGLVATGLLVFGGLFPSENKNYPLEFLSIPFFIWAAFRFGPRAAATAVVLLSGIAIWGTLHGFGPFVSTSQNQSLLLLQAFMGVLALSTLTLAAVVSERRRVEDRLREQATQDSLTGLANYRRLTEALGAEIRRSDRTQRRFAALFLDLDELKRINDRYGHLVGSEALCRLAGALRDSCRVIDTLARFGGDEFAVILPETEEPAAHAVARRIAERLAADARHPPLSVSVGVAVYPEDGRTVETLLGAADRLLYEAKARGTKPQPVRRAVRRGETSTGHGSPR